MARTTKKPYRKSRSIDRSCRSHGGCPWCLGNHRHATDKRMMAAKQKVFEAAVEFGEADIADAVASCAAELGLAMAIVDWERACNGEEPKYANVK